MLSSSVVLLLSGTLAVHGWSVNAPETVVHRHSVADKHTEKESSVAPAELRQRPDAPLEDQLKFLRGEPQAAVAQTVTIVRKRRPRRRHRIRSVSSGPRVLRYGDSVTPRWRRRSYGFMDSEEARAQEVVPGSRRPQSQAMPEGHRRVGSPDRQRAAQSRTDVPSGHRRVGYPPAPDSPHGRPASSMSSRTSPRERSSRTQDLENLYASKYGSLAPQRRQRHRERNPPMPPVYRNLCRRRSLEVIQQLPAPLRSICLDFLESRGRLLGPRIPEESVSYRDSFQEVRRPAESRAVRVRPGDVYVGPVRSNSSRRVPRRGSRRTAESMERSKSSRMFYKAYWPYKRNGQRYY